MILFLCIKAERLKKNPASFKGKREASRSYLAITGKFHTYFVQQVFKMHLQTIKLIIY